MHTRELSKIYLGRISNMPEYPHRGISHFMMVLHFILLLRYSIFFQIEGLWQLCLEQVCWLHFPDSMLSFHVSVSYFGNFSNISNFFITIIFIVVSVTSDSDGLKAQRMVSLF